MDYDRVLKAYLKMRAAKSELTREYEARKAAIEDQMATLDNVLLGSLHRAKVKSMATEAGTVYTETVTQVTCEDWTAFHGHLLKTGELEGLEKRVSRKFVEGYMTDHKGMLPPGIKARQETVVRVRVANT